MSRFNPRFSASSRVATWISRRTLTDDRQTNQSHGSMAPWQRPTEWLPMPSVAGEQKIAILVDIHEDEWNFVALTIAGAFTVDWGDGTATQSFSSGSKAERNIPWSRISPATTQPNGNRQALVIITPQSGQNLTSADFAQYATGSGSGYGPPPFLEVAISAVNLTYLRFGTTNSDPANQPFQLQKVSIYGQTAVTNMNNVFANCTALRDVHFDESFTSAATSATFMFYESSVSSIPNMNLRASSNVSNLFRNCYNLISAGDIDVRNANSTGSMFESCSRLEKVGGIATNSAQNVAFMFSKVRNLRLIPKINLSNATNADSLFQECNNITNMYGINLPKATRADFLLNGSRALRNIPFIKVPNATSASNMLYGASSIESIQEVDISKVANASYMFGFVRELRKLPSLNTSLVANAEGMFVAMKKLKSIPDMDMSNVMSAQYMFEANTCMQRLPQLNLRKATNCFAFIRYTRGIREINDLNTGSCTNFGSFASNSLNLRYVTNMNTAAATNVSRIFEETSIWEAPNLVTSQATDMSYMFRFVYGLDYIPNYDSSKATTIQGIASVTYTLRTVPALNASSITTDGRATPGDSNGDIVRSLMYNARVTHSYSNLVLSAEALNEIYTNLGDVSSLVPAKVITVSGNYGVASDNINIATDKGWTVTG